jgi:hypothetical protein
MSMSLDFLELDDNWSKMYFKTYFNSANRSVSALKMVSRSKGLELPVAVRISEVLVVIFTEVVSSFYFLRAFAAAKNAAMIVIFK